MARPRWPGTKQRQSGHLLPIVEEDGGLHGKRPAEPQGFMALGEPSGTTPPRNLVQSTQFSSLNIGTRENSLILLVTNTQSSASA